MQISDWDDGVPAGGADHRTVIERLRRLLYLRPSTRKSSSSSRTYEYTYDSPSADRNTRGIPATPAAP